MQILTPKEGLENLKYYFNTVVSLKSLKFYMSPNINGFI